MYFQLFLHVNRTSRFNKNFGVYTWKMWLHVVNRSKSIKNPIFRVFCLIFITFQKWYRTNVLHGKCNTQPQRPVSTRAAMSSAARLVWFTSLKLMGRAWSGQFRFCGDIGHCVYTNMHTYKMQQSIYLYIMN